VDCQQIEHDETIEAYLGGRLAADKRAAFEQHAFDCRSCFEKLQVLRAVQAEFWEQGSPAIAEAPSRRPPVLVRRWAFASAAALALVLIGAALWWKLGGRPERRAGAGSTPSAWAALAKFEAPAFLPPALRAGADEAAEKFRIGMENYTEGRYKRAIRDLQAAGALNPQASYIHFFLGVCHLLTGKTDKGISSLEKTIALGDPAYADEARFYLAKAWLLKGDAARARIELEAVADSGSRLAEEAARLLAMLGKFPSP
jgi:tetratricopeptide (TPR) repeat protein